MAVSVNFDDLRDKASDFRQEGDDLRDIINTCQNYLEELQSDGFEGATADSFISKYDELKPSLEEAAELLDSIGDALDTTADNFEDLDNDMASSIGG